MHVRLPPTEVLSCGAIWQIMQYSLMWNILPAWKVLIKIPLKSAFQKRRKAQMICVEFKTAPT